MFLHPSSWTYYVQFGTNIILNAAVNSFFEEIFWYQRYLDDIFLIFSTTDKMNTFTEWMNTIHPTIKFTHQIHSNAINYLDIVVYWQTDQKLAVRVFRKPTDKNVLLHYHSNYPWHLKNNVPYGQFLKMRRNCSKEIDYKRESMILNHQLRDREYPESVINTAWRWAQNINKKRFNYNQDT